MLRLLVTISLLTLASTVQAEIVKVKREKDKTQYLMYYQEGGFYFVDRFVQRQGRIQERVQHRQFASEDLAQIFFKNKGKAFKSFRAPLVGTQAREVTTEPLWQVTQAWNDDWENQYTMWVRDNVSRSFFQTYNVATDCADVAVGLRWIFARIHGLPAANHLMGSGQIFSHLSMKKEWLSLPTASEWYNDQRFRAALDFVMINTYTHTLMADSYPVEMNPDTALTPGAYFLYLFDHTGHTLFVNSTNPGGTVADAIRFVYSDVPREVRELFQMVFLIDYTPTEGVAGFLRMRWAEPVTGGWDLRAGNTMPWYSGEQFTSAYAGSSFYNAVLKSMRVGSIEPQERIEQLMQDVETRFRSRVKIVEDGYGVCSVEPCEPGSANYEVWSTPNRDQQIADQLGMAYDIFHEYMDRSEVADVWARWMKREIVMVEGKILDMQMLHSRWYMHLYSSDPREAITLRWGLNLP